jgi:drug/metabolite transporter (DMT)-like permease
VNAELPQGKDQIVLAIALAAVAGVGWGVSDFLGGLKSRQAPLLGVLLISQATALAVLAMIVAVRAAPPPTGPGLLYAALAGAGEVVGIAAVYRGLSVGLMSVVAPIAALAPIVPLLVGLAAGEVPGPVQATGLVLATLGVAISSVRRGPGGPETVIAHRLRPSIGYGLLGALGFGTFFLAMGRASRVDIPWSLFTSRSTAVVTLAVVAAVAAASAGRARMAVARSDVPVVVVIGVLIVAADATYATAATLGLISIAAAVGALHPLVTIGLARIRLHELLSYPQWIGIGTTLAGVAAISVA